MATDYAQLTRDLLRFYFENYAELLAKVSTQGPIAIQRIQRFADAANIVIPMRYEVNFL